MERRNANGDGRPDEFDADDRFRETRACRARIATLSPRESEVLNLLREGRPNKAIAAELGLKEATVKIHVRHIMEKLNVSNRTEAALMAERAR